MDGDGVDFEFNLRFPGQYYDTESGLHYNYFRDYEPGTGRYVQSDPIGLWGGLNTYNYADQNPLLLMDLYGLQSNNRYGDDFHYPWPYCLFSSQGCNPEEPDPIDNQIEIIKDCSVCIILCPKDVFLGNYGEELMDDIVVETVKRKKAGGLVTKILKKLAPGYSYYSTGNDLLDTGSCIIDCID